MADLFSKYKVHPCFPSLEYSVKTKLVFLRKLILYLGAEKRHPASIPFLTHLRAWHPGFTSLSYLLYNLNRNDPKDYLPDFSDVDYRLHNPGTASINDKLNLSYNLRLLRLSCPKVFAIIDRGSVLFQHENFPRSHLPTWIQSLLKTHKKRCFNCCMPFCRLALCWLGSGHNGLRVLISRGKQPPGHSSVASTWPSPAGSPTKIFF